MKWYSLTAQKKTKHHERLRRKPNIWNNKEKEDQLKKWNQTLGEAHIFWAEVGVSAKLNWLNFFFQFFMHPFLRSILGAEKCKTLLTAHLCLNKRIEHHPATPSPLHTHTHIHAFPHTRTHTHRTSTHACANQGPNTRTRKHSHTITRTTHTCTHTTLTYTHTHTHTHTHLSSTRASKL